MKTAFVLVFVCLLGLLWVRAEEGKSINEKLEGIVLPAKSSKDDVVLYYKALQKAVDIGSEKRQALLRKTEGGLVSFYNFPKGFMEKVDAIPTEFAGEILGLGKPKSPFQSMVIRSIIKRTDFTEGQREVILKYLPDNPDLIRIVLKQGWAKGADKAIIRTARERLPSDLGPLFVPLLASYESKEAKEVLTNLLTTGNPKSLIENLAALPNREIAGLDVAGAVEKAWRRLQEAYWLNELTQYAPVAAKYGHLDALVFIAKRLNAAANRLDSNDIKTRENCLTALKQLVPSGGSEEAALVKFVLSHRTTLVFDPALKEYRLPKKPE